jgi:hypothetical protein
MPTAHGEADLNGPASHEGLWTNPYYQYLCGGEFFQHPQFDRSSLTRWRQRMGKERPAAPPLEALRITHATGAIKSRDLQPLREACRLVRPSGKIAVIEIHPSSSYLNAQTASTAQIFCKETSPVSIPRRPTILARKSR